MTCKPMVPVMGKPFQQTVCMLSLTPILTILSPMILIRETHINSLASLADNGDQSNKNGVEAKELNNPVGFKDQPITGGIFEVDKAVRIELSSRRAEYWLGRIAGRQPCLFLHWNMGAYP